MSESGDARVHSNQRREDAWQSRSSMECEMAKTEMGIIPFRGAHTAVGPAAGALGLGTHVTHAHLFNHHFSKNFFLSSDQKKQRSQPRPPLHFSITVALPVAVLRRGSGEDYSRI